MLKFSNVPRARQTILLLMICFIILPLTGTVAGHFNFFIPGEWSMSDGVSNNIDIIWGHPYEGLYFDAPPITSLNVMGPDGFSLPLTPVQNTYGGVGSGCGYWSTSFKPPVRGDYILFADFEPMVVEEEEIAWEDHVKAVFHYKASNGWDRRTGQIMEIVPLTRPYGLEEGFIFTGQVFYNNTPLGSAPVEIEKYYSPGVCTDNNLPADAMVTRLTTTDVNGVFSFTLDEPGMWILCASNISGKVQGYDREIRGIFVLNVEKEHTLSSSPSLAEGSIVLSDTLSLVFSVLSLVVVLITLLYVLRKK